jgi:7-cyano-7-deazaguanine synthase
MSTVVLLSGGMDSTAVAFLVKPSYGIWIDYGQGPAAAEKQAARSVASAMDLDLVELRVDLSSIGTGAVGSKLPDGIAHEWWPYRNQSLITFAAAWGIGHGASEVAIGTVSTDGDRHVDGAMPFVRAMDDLLSMQEGGMRVLAPAISLTTEELIERSRISRAVLALTYSCHVSNQPCGDCGGCEKRDSVWGGLERASA